MKVQKLTAETLLSAPRRSPAVPNRNGTLALFTVSTHMFGKGTANEVRVMDIKTGSSQQLSTDEKVHDALWIPGTDDQVIYLRSGDGGNTQVFVASAKDTERKHDMVAELKAPVAHLKLKLFKDGSVVFVVTGLVGENGELYNEEVVARKSTARVFDTPNVRMWNELYKAQPYALWYTTLLHKNDKWTLASSLHNLLQNTRLEPAGMYEIADPLKNFDICQNGIAFIARIPKNRDIRTRSFTFPFFSPLTSFTDPPLKQPQMISLPYGVGLGQAYNVRISPDGSTIGLLHAEGTSVYDRKLYTSSVENLVLKSANADNVKDYESPADFEFAGDSSVILRRAKHGRLVLAHLKLQEGEVAKEFTSEGAVQKYFPLQEKNWNALLVTSTSFIDSCLVQIINVPKARIVRTVSSATKHGAKFGLSKKMVSEICYKGADELDIHAFVIKPNDFDEKKTYPWVLMPHGGPVSSHTDSWSTRWNAAAWAEQGYIIICPNFSGSTGFGLDFVKRINDQWGGKPYEDLVKLVAYLETLPYLDHSEGILAGGSYGGYMVSWFMGHDVIKKFCCAIWHDGIFSLPTFLLQSDSLPDNESFFGNRPPFIWSNIIALDKYNPARPELLSNFAQAAPPTLVIHSEKDYRVPITEGLAFFQTLQAQGVPSRFLTFEDEGHHVLGPENSLVWHEEVWGWMRRCVNGEIKRGVTQW